jgi:hypothetical protein
MKTLWVLILVKHGLIENPVICHSKKQALRQKQMMMKGFNPDYDEIELFEKKVNWQH